MSRPSPLLEPTTLDPHSLVGLAAVALYELDRSLDFFIHSLKDSPLKQVGISELSLLSLFPYVSSVDCGLRNTSALPHL